MNEEKLEPEVETDVQEENVEELKANSTDDDQSAEPNPEAEENTDVPAEEEGFKEKFYYLAAEMENMKKRFAREKDGIVKYGTEKILNGLLPVIDNLDRTLQAIATDEADDKLKNIVTGIEMVRDQFLETLKQNGLEPVESIGKSFDPNFHEALAQQPAEGKEDMEIIAEYEKGYILNGRLLRAAKVVVVKN